MQSKRPLVIVARKLLDPIKTRMMELFTCHLNLDDKALANPSWPPRLAKPMLWSRR